MGDAARRQRQLAAKASRRRAMLAGKKTEGAVSASLAGRIRVAAKGAIVQCQVSSGVFEAGMGTVAIARSLPSGLVGFAFFLLDVYCRGVKDALYSEVGRSELRSYMAEQATVQTFTDVDPAYARKLVRDAASYAAGLGLPAADDAPVIEAIFGDVDADACTETFTFGLNGKPYYVSGPNDPPARLRAIGRILEQMQDDDDLIATPPA